jgi:peptide deformylase
MPQTLDRLPRSRIHTISPSIHICKVPMSSTTSELSVIMFPHPTLRYPSKAIQRVDSQLKSVVDDMFRLMYEHKGVGLAANQVDLPIRLFVANPTGRPDEGEPMVFINPVISRGKGIEEAEEGCLSLPGINANIKRNKSIHVNAYDIKGNEINQMFDGFVARIIQHETDHLDGVLIIDRLGDTVIRSYEQELETLQSDYESRQRTGSLPNDEQILARRMEWEKRYC